jgi:hypothetical protein
MIAIRINIKMKKLFLEKIRLSVYFWTLLAVFTLLAYLIPRQKFSSGALALFSVNSFLYGFYIAPILSAQKARVEELHKAVRSEANAVFAMALSVKKLPDETRNGIQKMLINYLRSVNHEKKPTGGELEYEALITYCLRYKGKNKDEVMKLLDMVVLNQQNRTNFAMQMRNPVFSNEWSIMFVLFSITLGFVISIDAGSQPIFRFLAALLCTGLSMLLIILIKLSTLTHKKARRIWDPYKKLIDSHFYRIEE